jgi:hypothetical protein
MRGSGNNSVIFIPFSKDSTYRINALLIAWINNADTSFKFLYHWQYAEYSFVPRSDSIWDAMDFFNAFAYFEELVFNNTRFVILDTALVSPAPGYKTTTLTKGRTTSEPLGRLEAVEECTLYETCYYFTPAGDMGGGAYVRTAQSGWCMDYEVCTTYFFESGGGFSSGGGTSGGNPTPPPSNGGAGAWYSNPCTPTPGVSNPCNGGLGWVPIPIQYMPFDEPVDTILEKYSLAINSTADSMLNLSLANHNYEYVGTIVMKDGAIYTRNIRTDYDSMGVYPNFSLSPGEVLLGLIHTHPRYNVLDRSAPSPGDIEALRFKLISNFVSFTECGNVRYALVITDPQKVRDFFKKTPSKKLAESIYTLAVQQPGSFSNWQHATQVAVASVLGSSDTSGISFYISNNTSKTKYTLLNP